MLIESDRFVGHDLSIEGQLALRLGQGARMSPEEPTSTVGEREEPFASGPLAAAFVLTTPGVVDDEERHFSLIPCLEEEAFVAPAAGIGWAAVRIKAAQDARQRT